jgi:allantoate deiminase
MISSASNRRGWQADMTHSLIDPALVEQRILALARHGAYGKTGVWRTVYSPEWVAATDLYAQWCREAGLADVRDPVGNVWGRLQGSDGGPAIVSGSHIDTQRPGGRYDGALGAIAALMAIETLAARFGQPRRTLEAVALCEEEGSRFPTANFWGSRAITDAIAATDADKTVGYDDQTMSDAMRAVGLRPERIGEATRHDIESFIELHIEQGPVLEHANLPVAVVTGITGLRHYDVELTGVANHAGAFPMDLRRDPTAGFAEIVTTLISAAERVGRPAVTTIGRVFVEPNGASIIPGKVRFTVDARHRSSPLIATFALRMSRACARSRSGGDLKSTSGSPPTISRVPATARLLMRSKPPPVD